MAIDPTTSFDADTWTVVLAGAPIDGAALLRLRMTPPRIFTREAAVMGDAPDRWLPAEMRRDIPVVLAAEKFAVTPATIRGRCRRWGIPVYTRTVGGRGKPWGRRESVLTQEGFLALYGRTIRPLGPLDRDVARRASVWADGSPATSPAMSAQSIG